VSDGALTDRQLDALREMGRIDAGSADTGVVSVRLVGGAERDLARLG
jgi:hypothetical protein